MTLQEQIEGVLKAGKEALSKARAVETTAREVDPTWNPFDWGANALERKRRVDVTQARYADLGIERFLDGEAPGVFDFVTRRQPTTLKPGFGNLTVKKDALNKVLGNNNREVAIDNIAAMMQYTNSTIMIEDVGGRRATYLSKSAPSESYLRSQATNVYDMVNDKEGFSKKLDRALYIDIETSGLDDQASIWQVAMKSEKGGIEDVRMESALMDRGVYVTEAGGERRLVGFKEYMRMREGKELPTDDLVTGMTRVLDRINETDVIVGQNVNFDLERLLNTMEKLKGVDSAFDSKLEKARAKMLGEKSTIVDTRQLSAIRLGTDIPSATAEVADYKTFSQENIAMQTDVIQRMKNRMTDTEWSEFLRKLKQSGLHDAAVDIQVTEQIARAAFEGGVTGYDSPELAKQALDKLDPAIWEALESSAIVPTATKLGYGTSKKMTPLEALMRGTSNIEVYSFDSGKTDHMLRAGGFYDWRTVASEAGITEEAMQARQAATGASGFLNPEFAREINLEGQTANVADIVGRTSSGRTVQEMFQQTGVAFAGLSEHERLITSMLSEGNTIGRVAQRRLTETTRGAVGGMYFRAFGYGGSKERAIGHFQNVAINPDLITAYEEATEETLGSVLEHGRRAARISTVAPREGEARATVILDLFKSEEEARKFATGLGEMKTKLAEADQLDEGQERILRLLDEIEDFDKLGQELVSKLKYGVQVGQFRGDNVEAVVRTLDQLFPDRDVEVPKMGTVIEGLTPNEHGAVRTTAAVFDLQNRLDDAMLSNVEGAFASMRSLETTLKTGMGYTKAKVLSGEGVGRISKYIIDNPKTSTRAVIGATAVAGLAFLFRDDQKDERLEEPFEVTGYEGANDYQKYKASIGEFAEPGFQSRPMSTRDPLETSGAVQYLHDTKTRRHQMGVNKHAHLFGL